MPVMHLAIALLALNAFSSCTWVDRVETLGQNCQTHCDSPKPAAQSAASA